MCNTTLTPDAAPSGAVVRAEADVEKDRESDLPGERDRANLELLCRHCSGDLKKKKKGRQVSL